jgi:acetyltransferase-like isoleucine patch superfamily enzyme
MGSAYLGVGTKIFVNKGGELIIGSNFEITWNSAIICQKKIEIGKNCLISWDVQIMDGDAHEVLSLDSNMRLNPDRKIKIGDNVWIGCKTLIMKGSRIPDNSIIAAGSVIKNVYKEKNTAISSSAGDSIIRNVKWK